MPFKQLPPLLIHPSDVDCSSQKLIWQTSYEYYTTMCMHASKNFMKSENFKIENQCLELKKGCTCMQL